MTLDQIFSEENILDYSGVCTNLAMDIPERAQTSGKEFDTLMIPSRGAVPFLLGMAYSLRKLSDMFGGGHEQFYNGLAMQPMVSSLLSSDVKVSHDVERKPYRVLLVPFTADLNVEKFDGSLDNTEFTKNTRGYWAKVTKAFFKDPKERAKDPYFRSFADIILRDIEGRDSLAEAYESFPTIKKFSMIDTVISGRASTQILGAFEGLSALCQNPNLNPSASLIVDENGKKLTPEYARFLNRKKIEGKVTSYEIPRIVSEDEGASLLGVGAAIYPSVMKSSLDFCTGDETFFIGAGGWFNSADLPGNYSKNFKSFMDMIYSGIDYIHSKDFGGNGEKKKYEEFQAARASFLDRANHTKILCQTADDISALKLSAHYSYQECYETHSHVLHAPFAPRSLERIQSKIAHIPGVRLKEKEPAENSALNHPVRHHKHCGTKSH